MKKTKKNIRVKCQKKIYSQKKEFNLKKTLKRKNIDRILSMIITSQYLNKSKKKELMRLLSNVNKREISIIFSKLSV